MLNKKRALVSIGSGILIFVGGMFTLLFVLRLLNSPHWMYTIMIWILVWPARLAGSVFTIPYPEDGGVMFVLSVGIVIDIAILSGVIYAALSKLRKKSIDPLPPPQPPSFN